MDADKKGKVQSAEERETLIANLNNFPKVQ